MIINKQNIPINVHVDNNDVIIIDKDIDYVNNPQDEKLQRLGVGVINNIGFDIYQRNAGESYIIASIKVPAKQVRTLLEEIDIPRDIDYTTIIDNYLIVEWGYWHIVENGDGWAVEKPSMNEVLADIKNVCSTFRNY